MPEATVGIIGAGQLGRMLALAGYPLGVECVLLDRDENSPGGQVATLRPAALDDTEALVALARSVDVVTLDIENVPIAGLNAASRAAPVYPPPAAVEAAQDRLVEKELLRSLRIPVAPFVPIDRRQDLAAAGRALGWPVVLKARRMGYDGRGQRFAASPAELEEAFGELGEVPAIAEQRVEFDRELSLVAVQGARRERRYYPLAENVHREGILVSTIAPYDDPGLQRLAEQWLDALFDRLDYRGVLTVEFFATPRGLVANEMAPRVHNSGHWTIEGAETSQFENHLRAVLGWPLGDTAPRGHAAMVNLLGRLPPLERLLAVPGVHVHAYGKEPRAARKLGHCTLVDCDRARLCDRRERLQRVIAAGEP